MQTQSFDAENQSNFIGAGLLIALSSIGIFMAKGNLSTWLFTGFWALVLGMILAQRSQMLRKAIGPLLAWMLTGALLISVVTSPQIGEWRVALLTAVVYSAAAIAAAAVRVREMHPASPWILDHVAETLFISLPLPALNAKRLGMKAAPVFSFVAGLAFAVYVTGAFVVPVAMYAVACLVHTVSMLVMATLTDRAFKKIYGLTET